MVSQQLTAEMNEIPPTHSALLPTGLRDVLPTEAENEARLIEGIMGCFASHGYQRVESPLLEFEETLFAGSGSATAEHVFRLMDPDSQRMMGVRADITPQIGRIAESRLLGVPRPLRLAYSGQCLRVRGSHIQPERQIAQAGIELIGHDLAEADAEIVLTSAAALAVVGLHGISFDLTVPRLVLSLMERVAPERRSALSRALDRKDSAAIERDAGVLATLFMRLLDATGPVERSLDALLSIDLPQSAKLHAVRLAETVAAIKTKNPHLALTMDPIEFRGYQYHTGICVTVFAPGRQAELGRGGRYLSGTSEPATGITLYPDTIARVAPAPRLRPRIYLPHGTTLMTADFCRQQGFATIAGLTPTKDLSHEAARLSCSHIYQNGEIIALNEESK
jgi:ATP phosphoribosyltransferase regulatory subunit